MHSNPLISVEQLYVLQQQQHPLMVFDCSYDLCDPSLGQKQFAQEHIPGARYVDLHQDLSSHQPDRAASKGRHPLPLPEDFAATLRRWGFTNAMQAVVYDRAGCHYCGRLWWMLKWLGHDAVAVLDGGLPAWKAAGYPMEPGSDTPSPTSVSDDFNLRPPLVELVSTQDVVRSLTSHDMLLIDARGPARYRGETEPLDPVAGHIPGAINRPFTDNLQSDGRFKPEAILKQELTALLPAENTSNKKEVVYCGSGVSAIATLLALEIAGYHHPALYAGSWSAWCNTPELPIERS